MLAYIRNPKATMRYINNIPNQLLLAEVNIYILVLFFYIILRICRPKRYIFFKSQQRKGTYTYRLFVYVVNYSRDGWLRWYYNRF